MILSLPTENILPYPNANINFMLLLKRGIVIVINFILFLRLVISETSANMKDYQTVKHSDIKLIAAVLESISRVQTTFLKYLKNLKLLSYTLFPKGVKVNP